MSLMERETNLIVSDEVLTVEELIQWSPKEISSSLQQAGVIILPSHGTDDAFYGGTIETLDFLNDHDVPTEIYSTDDDYRELSLHGADLWLGTILVKYVFIP